jgi:ketosteroid isomerase-like protein
MNDLNAYGKLAIAEQQSVEQRYTEFLAAVARRDADAMLQYVGEDDASRVRAYRQLRSFPQYFERWCAKFPSDLRVVAVSVDSGTAVLEAASTARCHIGGRVALVLNDGAWRMQ